jgi:hypothetical protein
MGLQSPRKKRIQIVGEKRNWQDCEVSPLDVSSETIHDVRWALGCFFDLMAAVGILTVFEPQNS